MYFKKNFIRLFLIITVYLNILLPTSLFANDTMVGESGHTVFPINTDKIRMVSEKVTVKMGPDGSGIFDRKAFVTCEFLFENTSQEEIKAKLGFPTNEVWSDYQYLNDFVSYIDGVNKDVQIKKEILGRKIISVPSGEIITGDYQNRSPSTYKIIENYRNWYTWDVTFPPLKKIKVKNSYWVTLSSDQHVYFFEYILTTGVNWKGSIGKAEIEVIYKDAHDLRNRVIYVSPKTYKVEDNKIKWRFTNFQPKENIKIIEKTLWKQFIFTRYIMYDILNSREYEGGSRYYTQEDLDIKNVEEHKELNRLLNEIDSREYLLDSMRYSNGLFSMENKPLEEPKELYFLTRDAFLEEMNQLYVRVLRNEIFARHGKTFKSEDLKWIFKDISWYKPDPDFSYDMLNKIEKKNLEFIIEYEKKKGWRK